MPFNFPLADADTWGTWNVTFDPDASRPEKELDKTRMVQSISGSVPPSPDGNVLAPDWIDLDNEHSQLKVDFQSPSGEKVTRGAVRPPAVSKPPASRVVSIVLAVRTD